MENVKQREDRLEETKINYTKIKYLKVNDKIYEIVKISFFYMEIEAIQTNFTVDDVPEDELWDLDEFRNYKVKLINNGGMGEIVDFEEFKKGKKTVE